MIPAARRRCVYCAFKSHQLALQARRLKSTSTSTSPSTTTTTPLLPFISKRSSRLRDGRPDSRPSRYGAPTRRPSRDGTTNRAAIASHEAIKNHGNRAFRDIITTNRASRYEVPSQNPSRDMRWPTTRTQGKVWSMRDSPGGGEATFPERYARAFDKLLETLRDELKEAPIVQHLRGARDDFYTQDPFPKLWSTFIKKAHDDEHIRADLQQSFRARGARALEDRIKFAFYGYMTKARFTESDLKNQEMVADLRYPTELYPATRQMSRTIHLHVGPTNSGKTYHALQRLESAKVGAYAGPLRLLAHEVYTRLNAKGIACMLITGEERRNPDEGNDGDEVITSCTVEMMPLNRTMDVAVIDEIQMIGNPERGWAWTQALLGVRATEVHLCGEERTVPLIQELCASVGDKLVIHQYKRLSPLKMDDTSLKGSMKDLRKGDCIVSFSVMGIHALRKQIEETTGKKVAIVYGSLPPETRAQQARLFNDPDNDYDFLVASDAVGMGLNLAIKRMIFEASNKFDGFQRHTLAVADIKQIAGRAGRYRTAAQASQSSDGTQDSAQESVGLVTTMEDFDFPVVQAAMQNEPEPIRTAGILPPDVVLQRFASYFPPKTPFSYILTRLHEVCQIHSRFHLCGLKEQTLLADLIESVPNLTISDRNIITAVPASKTDKDLWKTLMPAFARCIADQTGGGLLEIESIPLDILDAEVSASREYLRRLELLHKAIVAYLWLSFRFAGIFVTRGLASHVKGLVEEKIEAVLGSFSFTEADRRRLAKQRQAQLMADMENAFGTENGKGAAADGVTPAEAAARAVAEEFDGDLERATEAAQRMAKPTEQQASLTSGGDHFGGEEGLAIDDGLFGSSEDQDLSGLESKSNKPSHDGSRS